MPAENGAGIAGIGHEVAGGGDEDNVGGASDCGTDEFAVSLACLLLQLGIVAVSNFVELRLSLLALNHLIDAAESVLQRLLEFFLLVCLAILELLLENLAHVLADFET